jgi:hypothetical protein
VAYVSAIGEVPETNRPWIRRFGFPVEKKRDFTKENRIVSECQGLLPLQNRAHWARSNNGGLFLFIPEESGKRTLEIGIPRAASRKRSNILMECGDISMRVVVVVFHPDESGE